MTRRTSRAAPRRRRRRLNTVARAAAALLGAYLIARGIAEFFTVHYNAPATYRNDWGGPSLAGVFAVHSGPGAAVPIGIGICLGWKVRARRRLAMTVPSDPRRS